MAFLLTLDMFCPERKFSPSRFSGSSGMKKSLLGSAKSMTVSNSCRRPSWMYWPRECRSVEKMTLEG